MEYEVSIGGQESMKGLVYDSLRHKRKGVVSAVKIKGFLLKGDLKKEIQSGMLGNIRFEDLSMNRKKLLPRPRVAARTPSPWMVGRGYL